MCGWVVKAGRARTRLVFFMTSFMLNANMVLSIECVLFCKSLHLVYVLPREDNKLHFKEKMLWNVPSSGTPKKHAKKAMRLYGQLHCVLAKARPRLIKNIGPVAFVIGAQNIDFRQLLCATVRTSGQRGCEAEAASEARFW